MTEFALLFALVFFYGTRIQGMNSAICSGIFRPLTGLHDYCYWMLTDMQSSEQSNESCGQDGGTLAWVNSPEAQAFVEKTFNQTLYTATLATLYIGVQGPDVSGDYHVYNGEKQYYFNWDASVYTPPGRPDWNCVMLYYDVNSAIYFKWRETRCILPKQALCSRTIQREYLSSYFDKAYIGKTFSGHEVVVLENLSFIRCAFACQMNIRCRSINHDVTNRRCTINGETAESYPSQLTAAPNVNYYTVFI
ncbi:tetranectin-like protein [Saccostrea echinata]|uniref:tetranectin-like protein n=1 Tax=Saccostrea echinata TaxID=191078 RepID=UPI002A821E41|nr:tetranectin-like protein [Saccostrea echinata]